MTTKTWLFLGIGLFVAGLACGRFTMPSKVTTKSSTTTAKESDTEKTDNSVVYITHREEPDGTKTTVTKIEKNVVTDESSDTKSTSKQEVTKTYDTGRVTLSALVTSSLTSPRLVYGGSVECRILGPIQIGALGLSNGTIGISLGLRL